MKVSVFVLHYQEPGWAQVGTDTVVHTLLQDIPEGGITVIDNGGQPEYANLWGVPVVRYEQNLHLIPAFNRAMQQYDADVYVCVTNDTKPGPRMVDKLVKWFRNPKVGVVAPATNDQGAGILFTGDGPDLDHPFIHTLNVDNTCWAFSRKLVEEIGWPDAEGHTHRANWYSNRDFCYRARQAGFIVAAARNAYIWHAHNGGQDKVADEAGLKWLKAKWGEEWQKVL